MSSPDQAIYTEILKASPPENSGEVISPDPSVLTLFDYATSDHLGTFDTTSLFQGTLRLKENYQQSPLYTEDAILQGLHYLLEEASFTEQQRQKPLEAQYLHRLEGVSLQGDLAFVTSIGNQIDHNAFEEYTVLLEFLAKKGTHKSIDYLVDHFIPNGIKSALYKERLVRIFSSIDPQYATQKLLELLNKHPDTHSHLSRNIVRILFCIQFGTEISFPDEEMDQVYLRYATFVQDANRDAEEIYNLSVGAFPEQPINKPAIFHALLHEANSIIQHFANIYERKSVTTDNLLPITTALEQSQTARLKLLEQSQYIAKELSQSALAVLEEYYSLIGMTPPQQSPQASPAPESLLSLMQLQTLPLETFIPQIQAYLKTKLEYLTASASYSPNDVDIIQEISVHRELSGQVLQILRLKKSLRQKFENLLFGRESALLDPETFSDMSPASKGIQPDPRFEQFSPDEILYFPVGISADLPLWEAVFDGKKEVAKPIDLYTYLFWLNSQNRDVHLVVCDTLQESNYISEYDIDPKDAKQKALQIGSWERENYQKIIEAFGLSHVHIHSYEAFLEKQRESFEDYRALCMRLSQHPIFEDAFLSAVQTSRADTPEEKRKHLPYAIDEISWILATKGVKIGHVNEARYDAIALLIQSVESLSQDPAIFDLDHLDALETLLCEIVSVCREEINTATDEPRVLSKPYFTKFKHVLFGDTHSDTKGINLRKRKIPVQTQTRKIVKDSFARLVPANIDSLSFGWRSAGERTEERMLFREPYSTYFYDGTSAIFLESDQVVAAPHGLISGKILTFSEKRQQGYAERVLKPLFLHYFKTLETAPQTYFEEVNATREDLLIRCQSLKTLNDALRFVQKYIVIPSTKISTSTSKGTVS